MWFLNIHKQNNTNAEYILFDSENNSEETICFQKNSLKTTLIKFNVSSVVILINGFGIYHSKKNPDASSEKVFTQKYTNGSHNLYCAIKEKELYSILFLFIEHNISLLKVFIGDGLGTKVLSNESKEITFGDSMFSVNQNGEFSIEKKILDSDTYRKYLTLSIKQLSNNTIKSSDQLGGNKLRLLIVGINFTVLFWQKRKLFILLLLLISAFCLAINYGYKSSLEKKEFELENANIKIDIEQEKAIKYQSIVGDLKTLNIDRHKYISVLLTKVFSGINDKVEVKFIEVFPKLNKNKSQKSIQPFNNSITIEGIYINFTDFENWISYLRELSEVKQVIFNDFKKVKDNNNYSISIELN